ncbi:CpsD/CapB family tyrosine-protein kinase [Clostridium saccharoperbutylacetonicum]|uniref:CpsD/CapB family tyrosine-protein kinase n=1 Tax=Clostridium saccharoperbutylacetonicum TaxID=36745 RepID=UPI0009838EB5|nr:CpsD/CapB family tyrosine-protein kinase [Clostridium saccharoperbutylacetonicum]AQR95093.1 tyrosine-protein kinase YwqD [Clostridium saccharoperbutylacetonicum]NSB30940.1 capsular exopolysaccharide synthesis family protein [Clostridium saccharoperbutylacetonicum]
MLIVEAKPNSIEAEAYRTLRTNIQYSSIDKEIKSIVVTSVNPNEGKSTIVGNLGLSFSQNEKKVIVIDCDLKKPSMHTKFGVSNLIGLSDVLIGNKTLENAIQKYNSNFHILTSGKIPPNSAEMINSVAMNNLLEGIKMKYDVMIIDSPPLGAFTDGQILAAKSDGVILVVEEGKTKIEAVKEGKNLLNKVGASIIGIVINKMSSDKKKDYYYYETNETKNITKSETWQKKI